VVILFLPNAITAESAMQQNQPVSHSLHLKWNQVIGYVQNVTIMCSARMMRAGNAVLQSHLLLCTLGCVLLRARDLASPATGHVLDAEALCLGAKLCVASVEQLGRMIDRHQQVFNYHQKEYDQVIGVAHSVVMFSFHHARFVGSVAQQDPSG